MSEESFGDLTGVSFESSSSYTIIEEIGRGGMGIVFLAEKYAEGVVDEVVLKTLRSMSPEHEKKLQHEANIATALRHENIVKTYGLETVPVSLLPAEFRREMEGLSADKGRRREGRRLGRGDERRRGVKRRRIRAGKVGKRDDKKLFMLVMDYVEGVDLRTLHRNHTKRRLLIPCILSGFIISRMCRALAYAHQWIVHRDISPENVLLNEQGVAKLSDFGIAVPAGAPGANFAGKLGFMAPEQLRGGHVDGRSDIYSLGIVLYRILTGIPVLQPPLNLTFHEQVEEALRLSEEHAPPPPHEVRPDIPKVLSDICMAMMDPNPGKRLPRAEDVGSLLEQKYLYAAGFGPTNNSLAAYMGLVSRDFKDATQDELRQLKFLKSEDGRIRVQRSARGEDYTDLGRDLLEGYKAYRRG